MQGDLLSFCCRIKASLALEYIVGMSVKSKGADVVAVPCNLCFCSLGGNCSIQPIFPSPLFSPGLLMVVLCLTANSRWMVILILLVGMERG